MAGMAKMQGKGDAGKGKDSPKGDIAHGKGMPAGMKCPNCEKMGMACKC